MPNTRNQPMVGELTSPRGKLTMIFILSGHGIKMPSELIPASSCIDWYTSQTSSKVLGPLMVACTKIHSWSKVSNERSQMGSHTIY